MATLGILAARERVHPLQPRGGPGGWETQPCSGAPGGQRKARCPPHLTSKTLNFVPKMQSHCEHRGIRKSCCPHKSAGLWPLPLKAAPSPPALLIKCPSGVLPAVSPEAPGVAPGEPASKTPRSCLRSARWTPGCASGPPARARKRGQRLHLPPHRASAGRVRSPAWQEEGSRRRRS